MTATPPPRPDATRTRLLEAAERILIEQGVHALTVRRVGAVSGLNGTLVT
jgi:AcrR family transcriptional regulator